MRFWMKAWFMRRAALANDPFGPPPVFAPMTTQISSRLLRFADAVTEKPAGPE